MCYTPTCCVVSIPHSMLIIVLLMVQDSGILGVGVGGFSDVSLRLPGDGGEPQHDVHSRQVQQHQAT